MKTFVKIYKAILLWATIISIAIYIMGFESMVEESRWALMAIWFIMNILFCWMCKSVLTVRDVYKLSGTYYFEKLLG